MFTILCAILLVPTCYSDITSKSFELNLDEAQEFKDPLIDPSIREDAKATTIELVQKYGYTTEIHHVVTEDGYILQLHRITASPKSPLKRNKVCYLQHGILDSSGSSVLAGPEKGLAFVLADQGYDVWMGNSRGNFYSTKHLKYEPHSLLPYKRKKFWDFSWHQIGKFDLPASIDYVLRETGQSKLQYIGHSQGTTAFFVMMSEKPEYNDKVEMMHALSPIAFLGHVVSPPIKGLTLFLQMLDTFAATTAIHFIPSTRSVPVWAATAYKPVQVALTNTLMAILGYNTDQMNSTLLPVIFGHTPAGCSVNQLLHYGQLVKSGRFRQFDHGYFGNRKHYQQSTPPDYNLKNVKVPVALYYSPNDWLSVVEDVQRLKQELPNVVEDHMLTEKLFNHMDLMWGIDAKTVVYDKIINSIEGFDKAVDA